MPLLVTRFNLLFSFVVSLIAISCIARCYWLSLVSLVVPLVGACYHSINAPLISLFIKNLISEWVTCFGLFSFFWGSSVLRHILQCRYIALKKLFINGFKEKEKILLWKEKAALFLLEGKIKWKITSYFLVSLSVSFCFS